METFSYHIYLQKIIFFSLTLSSLPAIGAYTS